MLMYTLKSQLVKHLLVCRDRKQTDEESLDHAVNCLQMVNLFPHLLLLFVSYEVR